MTKEEFLKDVTNFSNHRYLLWEALEATKHLGFPVLELGTGWGSTPYLTRYCDDNKLELDSFESNAEWAEKMGTRYVADWDKINWNRIYSVALVDESPGGHRKESIKRLQDTAKIIIIHDSEPIGWNSSDYQVRPLFGAFKYVHDLQSDTHGGAWATWLSNYYPHD